MKVTVEHVSSRAESTWTAKIDPQSLLKLGNPIHQEGQVSILLISNPTYNLDNRSLQFDLKSAVFLNLGNTSKVILIDSMPDTANRNFKKKWQDDTKLTAGDRFFLKELKKLPAELQETGRQLLTKIRQKFPGELKFHERSKKFVESPDNFWVVRIQPRDKSLRIIIYGRPEEHNTYNTIQLKPDMASYSSFKIMHKKQLHDALSVITEAKKLKNFK